MNSNLLETLPKVCAFYLIRIETIYEFPETFSLNIAELKLGKQNRFAKNSERSEEKGSKNILDLRMILRKMQRVLTRFCKLIWTDRYYESLWNHVDIQQGVFNRFKTTYYMASSMNNSEYS